MSEQPGGELLIYQCDDGTPAIHVKLSDSTVWLTQQQIAGLLGTTQQNVSLHLNNIYSEGELDEAATHKDFLLVRAEGTRQVRRNVIHYNLDAIISVGYRVQSRIATQFRIWATKRLQDYIVKGFAMDDARLKELGGGTYWRELLERIRDIRSSEKVMYRQVLDLYATSVDYDPQASETTEFFQKVQNKLHFASHGHTAAEVIYTRADASKPSMGLTTYPGQKPRKADIMIAKNYLAENELKQLNTLVSAYFDAAEFRAQRHEPTYMRDWLAHLDRLITAMDAPTLANAGTVSRAQAEAKADREYQAYRSATAEEPTSIETAYLETIKNVQKEIEGNK